MLMISMKQDNKTADERDRRNNGVPDTDVTFSILPKACLLLFFIFNFFNTTSLGMLMHLSVDGNIPRKGDKFYILFVVGDQ